MARPVTLPFNVANATGTQTSPYPLANFQQNYTALQSAINDPASGYVNLVYDTGTANAYAGTLNPAPSAMVSGLTVVLKIANSNTGASTFNLNSLGAQPIVNMMGQALSGGALPAGGYAVLTYDATASQWVLTNVVNLPSILNISTSDTPNTLAQRDNSGILYGADPASTDTQGLVTVNYANNNLVASSLLSVNPNANTVALRNSNGILYSANPTSSDTQGTVTVGYLNSITSVSNKANMIAQRDANGVLYAGSPPANNSSGVVNLAYLQNAVGAITGSASNTGNTIAVRGPEGNAQFTNALPCMVLANLNMNASGNVPVSSIVTNYGGWTTNSSGLLVTPVSGVFIGGVVCWASYIYQTSFTLYSGSTVVGGAIVGSATTDYGTQSGSFNITSAFYSAANTVFYLKAGAAIGNNGLIWAVRIPFTS